MPIADFISAGSGAERSLRRNTDAFADYEFLTHVGRDVSKLDLSVDFLGHRLELPLAVAPIGGLGLVCADAELATARAAGDAKILFCLSAMSTATIEAVATACKGPKIFQLYPLTDEAFTVELIQRAKDAGYDALCVTVDVQASPPRERSTRWGDLTKSGLPPLRTVIAMARHPRIALQLRRQQRAGLFDTTTRLSKRGGTFGIRNDYGWDFIRKLGELWGGPLLVKGVLRADDAMAAAGIGASAIVVCNHGGNGLDGAIASVDAIEAVVNATSWSIPIVQCGGIRNGANLLTSLALGARIGMTGRPFMYGAAAAGEAGVARVIAIFKEQFACAMRLAGSRSTAEIDRSLVRRRLD
jgi:L-lactate dehydrogenase (cytochrome)